MTFDCSTSFALLLAEIFRICQCCVRGKNRYQCSKISPCLKASLIIVLFDQATPFHMHKSQTNLIILLSFLILIGHNVMIDVVIQYLAIVFIHLEFFHIFSLYNLKHKCFLLTLYVIDQHKVAP